MRAKALLNELIIKHQDWNWEDLEDQGFVEIMQAFRFAPEGEQKTVVLAFTVVKEYIRRLFIIEEKKNMEIKPNKLVYENKLYNNAFSAGIKEYQLRIKKKKTYIEKRYVEAADKLGIDIQTVILISSLTNGYRRTKDQIIQWAKKQYTQNKSNSYGDYYHWLSIFISKISDEDFSLFVNEKTTIPQKTS